jgi:hypothetical protein
LSWIGTDEKFELTCCIAPEDCYQTQVILTSKPVLEKWSSVNFSVGLLSLFPHKNSLGFLAQSLNALTKVNLPIYGLSSSLSSITFVTDYHRLQDTKHMLKEFLKTGWEHY